VALLLLSLVSVPALRAQDVDDLPAFEVSSIREATTELAWSPSAPNRFVRRNATLVQLATYAYDLSSVQVEGGPSWRESRAFDVLAVAGEAVPAGTMQLMVRRLLAERFAFRAHFETREMPIYELQRARPDGSLGEGIGPTTTDCAALARQVEADRQAGGPTRLPCGGFALIGTPESGAVRRIDTGQLMPVFARSLEAYTGRIVVDRTGLTGRYDIDLRSEMPRIDGVLGEPGPVATEPGMSIFTALEEQLGLRLVSATGPVDVLVIDAAELPTPN